MLLQPYSSEFLVAEVFVESQGGSVPQLDDIGLADLIGPSQHHLNNLFEGPVASYIAELTYLLPVAYIVGFRLVLFSAAK